MRSDFQANYNAIASAWAECPALVGMVRETSRWLLSNKGLTVSPSTVARVAAVIQHKAKGQPLPSPTPEPQPAYGQKTPPMLATPAPTQSPFKTPVPTHAPASAPDMDAAVRALAMALAGMQSKPTLDAEAVRGIVQPMLDAHAPKVLQFVVPDRPAPSEHIESAHAKLPEAVVLAQVLRLVWLCGPAGSGKTTLAEQIAKSLTLPFGSLSCTAGMSEAHLTGRPTLQGGYIPARFVELYETGGVFLLDEFDACDPNTALVINSALANGYASVPYRTEKQRADRHKDFVCIVATNTWGNGADPQYLGRNGLDLATRDRFAAAKLLIEYDPALELRIMGDKAVLACIAKIRANIANHKLRRTFSTRAVFQLACLMRAGLKPSEAFARYLTDWSETETVKGMDGVRLPAEYNRG